MIFLLQCPSSIARSDDASKSLTTSKTFLWIRQNKTISNLEQSATISKVKSKNTLVKIGSISNKKRFVREPSWSLCCTNQEQQLRVIKTHETLIPRSVSSVFVCGSV